MLLQKVDRRKAKGLLNSTSETNGCVYIVSGEPSIPLLIPLKYCGQNSLPPQTRAIICRSDPDADDRRTSIAPTLAQPTTTAPPYGSAEASRDDALPSVLSGRQNRASSRNQHPLVIQRCDSTFPTGHKEALKQSTGFTIDRLFDSSPQSAASNLATEIEEGGESATGGLLFMSC
ncbi:hypothetical protein F66182_6151 [Fusarium sp. NRRL 66182]|nr:hypothetical protein F66182_6151 [Fusarium sp. NRRL 66182]